MSFWNNPHFLEPQTEEERKRFDLKERARKDRLNELSERRMEQQIREAEQQVAEQLAEQRKQQNEDPERSLTNPRWEHTDEEVAQERPDAVYIGETIKLIVDQQNLDTRRAKFEIRDLNINKKMDSEQGVDDVRKKIDSPSPEIEWVVLDPRSKKEAVREMDVLFLVTTRGASSDVCKIPVIDRPTKPFLFSV